MAQSISVIAAKKQQYLECFLLVYLLFHWNAVANRNNMFKTK